MGNRIGGVIFFKVDGVQYPAKGNFSYSLGTPKREAIMGADGFHGYKEMPQVCYIEGEISDTYDLDVNSLLNVTNGTVLLELANGKSIVLRGAYYAGEGKLETEEGKVAIRFEGASAEEVK